MGPIISTIIIIAVLLIFGCIFALIDARSEIKEFKESFWGQCYFDGKDPELQKKREEKRIAREKVIQRIQQEKDSEFTYLKLFKVGEVKDYNILQKVVNDINSYVNLVYPDYLLEIGVIVCEYIRNSQLYQDNDLVKIMNSWK